jgi:hypothetical protein
VLKWIERGEGNFPRKMGNNTREIAHIKWVINLVLNWFNDHLEQGYRRNEFYFVIPEENGDRIP